MFLVADSLLVPFSLYFAFALRFGTLFPMDWIGRSWLLFPLLLMIGIATIQMSRLPQVKLKTFENRALLKIAKVGAVLTVAAILLSYTLNLNAPRSVPIVFGLTFFLSSVVMRLSALSLFGFLLDRSGVRVRVGIYGAGAAGIQMAVALRQATETHPVLFVDNNPHIQGLMVAGLPVFPPKDLEKLVKDHRLERILIAIPSMSADGKKRLSAELGRLPVEVQVLPSYIEMMQNGSENPSPRPVSPNELLGRSTVVLNTPEIEQTYAKKVVMVTGAGGSIWSELCRQLLDCNPSRIVLFEQGEYNLYMSDGELRALAQATGTEIVTRLGSVTDKERVKRVIADEKVEIILHAAAYKHVPLVEDNGLEGARNNVIGTQVVAQAAQEAGLERFILISTDKAVRPTNIMGATKRMAELVVQDMQTQGGTTKFAMVRFGNVLGSSGSVLPLFQRQIAAGGPLTVTHPEVTRFFMTIAEAARLVLLAGAYARGGDVFVLDMGKPQRIIDIARQMIELSGRTVMDPKTGEGDIAIEIVGLRPGEKLYEELLIDDDSLQPTQHPKILQAQEGMLTRAETAAMLDEVDQSISSGDGGRFVALLKAHVEGYTRS